MANPAAPFLRAFAALRRRRPFVDHLVRTVQRYQADTGDQLAAAVTYYWFLSLFPVVLLAVALLGHVYGDSASEKVSAALSGVLPAQVAGTLGDTVQKAAGPAGVLGVLGLLYSGLGWIDGLRQAIRTVWHQNVNAGNIVTSKLWDAVALVGLFVTIAASVVVTGFVTGFSDTLLRWLGQDPTSTLATLLTRLLGYGLALLADVALFVYLFVRLARVRSPLRNLVQGAVFGAVGFEVLKVLGGIYVARTTTRGAATYGTFAVVVGVLLFLNLVSRLLLYASAFVVTGPYDSDVAPSGTSSPELARRAGIPEHYATRAEPPAVREDGAPSPLPAVLAGRTPPQDQPTDLPAPAPAPDAPDGPPPATVGPQDRPDGRLPSPQAVQAAARLVSAAGAVGLGAVAWYAAGALRRVVRG